MRNLHSVFMLCYALVFSLLPNLFFFHSFIRNPVTCISSLSRCHLGGAVLPFHIVCWLCFYVRKSCLEGHPLADLQVSERGGPLSAVSDTVYETIRDKTKCLRCWVRASLNTIILNLTLSHSSVVIFYMCIALHLWHYFYHEQHWRHFYVLRKLPLGLFGW